MSRYPTSLLFTISTLVLGACGGDGGVVNPPPPPVLAIVSGNNQSAVSGLVLPQPLTVSLTSADGTALAGQTVNWSITKGNGTLSSTSVVTDAQGHASVTWTLGDPGNQSAVASVGGFGVGFAATAEAPPPPPGSLATILHYDGTSWSVALEGGMEFNAVWGTSASAVFAVGGNCLQTLVYRYDGATWAATAQNCGAPGAHNWQYTSVGGTTPTDVYAIGENKFGPGSSPATWVSHFDGQSWSDVYKPNCSACGHLHAIWSRSASDVFAVGDTGVVLHYDGTTWSPQTSGSLQSLNAVFGVSSTGPIFAVGDAGTILAYNGTAWQAQTSGTTQPLYAVWGSSPTDVFAAGANGTILHFDGNAWSNQTSGTTKTLRGVWGSSKSSVYAVGYQTTILHFDGTNWTTQSAGPTLDLHGIWGSSPTDIFAVGHR